MQKIKNFFKKLTKDKIVQIIIFILFFLIIFGKDFFNMIEEITSDYRIVLFSIIFAFFVAFILYLYIKFIPQRIRKDIDFAVGNRRLTYKEAKKSRTRKFVWYLRKSVIIIWLIIIVWILIKIYILN